MNDSESPTFTSFGPLLDGPLPVANMLADNPVIWRGGSESLAFDILVEEPLPSDDTDQLCGGCVVNLRVTFVSYVFSDSSGEVECVCGSGKGGKGQGFVEHSEVYSFEL